MGNALSISLKSEMSLSVNETEIEEALEKIAQELRPLISGKTTAFIGLKSRGDEVAERLVTLLAEDDTAELLLGTLDVSLYRDDLSRFTSSPALQGSEIDFPLDDMHVILVDDVLFTGRTIRAALDALTDYGRPSKIELAVLVDRGHRELPISPDYVGLTVETEKQDHIKVFLERADGREAIEMKQK